MLLGSLVLHHYVWQQPPTVVPAKVKGRYRMRVASFPVVVAAKLVNCNDWFRLPDFHGYSDNRSTQSVQSCSALQCTNSKFENMVIFSEIYFFLVCLVPLHLCRMMSENWRIWLSKWWRIKRVDKQICNAYVCIYCWKSINQT